MMGREINPMAIEAYNEIKDALGERKKRLAHRVNHVQQTILQQTQRPDRESWTREKTARSMLREQKRSEAVKKAQEHTFIKVKKALLDTYSHDLRVYQEDIDFRRHYHQHLRLAVAGFWLHALAFVECCAAMKELIFQERYKLLKVKLKKSKQAYASRLVREAIARFRSDLPLRDLLRARDGLHLVTRLLDPDRAEQQARAVVGTSLLSGALVANLRRRDQLQLYVRKSRRG